MADKDVENGCKENKLEETVENLNITSQNTDQQYNEEKDSPVREITQTDHLNKRLLGAFLDQLNEKGDNLESNKIEVENGDWESDNGANKQ